MSYELLNSIFARFYDFFMTLVQMLKLPFNNLSAYWSYTNPFTDTLVTGGLPEFLSELFTNINNLLFFWVEPILHSFGLTLASPVWHCLLVILPIIFIFIVLIKIIASLVKPT